MQAEPKFNRFQRWYFAWAEPHYLRMEPDLQRQARTMGQFLVSGGGLGVWLGLGGAWLGSSTGLIAAGMPWPMAMGLTLVAVAALACVVAGSWLMPSKNLKASRFLPRWLGAVLGAGCGAFVGWLVMRLFRQGWQVMDNLPHEFDAFMRVGLPAGLAAGVLLGALSGLTALVRRYQLQQELQEARAAEERARAAREASEARLRLLQAQIQPHFIFNTLSAVQHWVDSGDARASGLLRALTGFLRGSAELMLKPQISLAEELTLLGHYLKVMQARWGERLRYEFDIDAATAERAQLPPGIVLSLVENALEHGLAQTLSGGRLRVSLQPLGTAGGWTLRVQDDGMGLAGDWQAGLGLANSRARLEAAFGIRAELHLRALDEGGTCAELVVQGGEAEQGAAHAR